LAHNVWNQQSNQAVAKIIHNFGRADELDRGSLVRLCKSIARVCGVDVNEPTAPKEKHPFGRDQDLLAGDVKLICIFHSNQPPVPGESGRTLRGKATTFYCEATLRLITDS